VIQARPLLISLLALIALLVGCASGPIDSLRTFASVTPLPPVIALQGQSPRDQEWDVRDCQAEAGYKTNYSPTDSPMANLFQKIFFWGTAGASLGGTIDGFPTVIASTTLPTSQASTGLIVGASTGGAAGAAASWKGQTRYERAWAGCIESRGYAITPPGTEPPPALPPAGRRDSETEKGQEAENPGQR
jgi:hypothetical protein